MANHVRNRGRRLSTPATAEAARDRSILVDLIRPIAADDAFDCAEMLLTEFRTFPEALAAGAKARERVLESYPDVSDHLTTIHEALLHCLRERVIERPVVATSDEVVNLLRMWLGNLPSEQVVILFLDSSNSLLTAELVGAGTVDRALFYPREVLRRAIELGATGLIVAHNHPSGDRCPSASDIAVTHELATGAGALGIVIHDHLIITRSGWNSLKAMGII